MLDPTPYRRLFPITERFAFFNHAGVSALNTRAVEAMSVFNERSAAEPFAQMYEDVAAALLDLCQRLPTLINARSADEIVLKQNTAMGDNSAAQGLPMRRGDTVLVLDGDFPANIYPW